MKAAQRDESDERVIHRLEAFSDIVIGFSLAQLSLNFVIPARMEYVYTRPVTLIAFAFTFFVISIFWWAHRRVFADWFVPTRFTVILNFIVLGLVVWLVYQLQLFIRFEPTPDRILATTSYVITYALVYILLGVLLLVCMRIRWKAVDETVRRSAIGALGRIAAVSLGQLAALLLCRAFGWEIQWSFCGILAGLTIWLVLRRAVERAVLVER